jgi:S1-C subfamily serine protease
VLRAPLTVALSLGLALASATPAAARADLLAALEEEQTRIFERVAPAVVVVSHGPRTSAGFAVAAGLVVTAAHAVGDARHVEVTLRDGRTVRGEVVDRSPHGLDLALVRVPVTPAAVLDLAAAGAVREGSVVLAVGHVDGFRWSLATGIVSSAATDGAGASLLRLQLPLRPGASGGPAVDRAGRVIGVVTQGASDTVAFAIRSEVVLAAFPALAAAIAAERGVSAEIAVAEPRG